MKNIWLIAVLSLVIAETSWGQQRPGGGRPGGGGPGGGGLGDFFRNGGADMLRGMQGGGGGDWQSRIQGMMSQRGMTFNEAPTLRMSLFEVVDRIGGPKAEGILIGELNATLRGAEVVFLDQLLTKKFGDKYQKDVINAAQAILLEETIEDTGFRSDARGTDQLWGLLRKYEDKTFADQAQGMLVNDEGGFNRGARDYLNFVLGENIMYVYQELYEGSDVTDDTRRSIREAAGRYMGENDAANAIVTSRFQEVMDELANQPAEPAEGQEGGRGRGRGGSNPRRTAEYYLGRLPEMGREVSAEEIAGRQKLLGNFRSTTNDPEMVAMMDKVGERLNAMAADPTKVRELPRFSLRERPEGERRGRGTGGGPGRGGGQ